MLYTPDDSVKRPFAVAAVKVCALRLEEVISDRNPPIIPIKFLFIVILRYCSYTKIAPDSEKSAAITQNL
jgi:hypothetical protein